jgi:hypothetical protein
MFYYSNLKQEIIIIHPLPNNI